MFYGSNDPTNSVIALKSVHVKLGGSELKWRLGFALKESCESVVRRENYCNWQQ